MSHLNQTNPMRHRRGGAGSGLDSAADSGFAFSRALGERGEYQQNTVRALCMRHSRLLLPLLAIIGGVVMNVLPQAEVRPIVCSVGLDLASAALDSASEQLRTRAAGASRAATLVRAQIEDMVVMETTNPTTKAVANSYAVSVTDAAAGSAFHSPGTDPALSHTLHTVLAQLLGDLEVDMIYLTRRGTADRNKFVMYGVQAGYSALASAPPPPPLLITMDASSKVEGTRRLTKTRTFDPTTGVEGPIVAQAPYWPPDNPWYAQVEQSKFTQPTWAAPHTSPWSGVPVVTYATPCSDGTVVAVDIRVSELTDILRRVRDVTFGGSRVHQRLGGAENVAMALIRQRIRFDLLVPGATPTTPTLVASTYDGDAGAGATAPPTVPDLANQVKTASVACDKGFGTDGNILLEASQVGGAQGRAEEGRWQGGVKERG
jgi:hypothetical protein